MCDCRKLYEDKMLELFVAKYPDATGHKTSLCGYAFVLSGNSVGVRGCMPSEQTASFPLKNGSFKRKTIKSSMMFNYCPFCGEGQTDKGEI